MMQLVDQLLKFLLLSRFSLSVSVSGSFSISSNLITEDSGGFPQHGCGSLYTWSVI